MTDRPETPFAANDVRLSPREWAVALVLVAAIVAAVPAAWDRLEPLEIEANHRMPWSLGEDYWIYDRYCRGVCAGGDETLVVGDSVVWGHYVGKDETLSAHLNRAPGGRRLANLGIDGIHPAALAGLVEHYGAGVRDRKVILHCNLLWMSSPRHDLRGTKEFRINHPDLIPQFRPHIACYKASAWHRLGVVIGRSVPFSGWLSHVQIAYLDNADLASWTIKHPYDNPAGAAGREAPSPDDPPAPTPDARAWTARPDISRIDPPWVDLGGSLQWDSFKRTVDILAARGNRVFVLVGPFNEHMLEERSLAAYTETKAHVGRWLRERKIPHCIAAALPSEVYADASHPLAEGYALLAAQLLADDAFIRFAGGTEAP